MKVYIIATILSVFFGYIYQHAKKETIQDRIFAKIVLVISAIPLFCVAAFRYNVGTDYSYTYTQRFLWRIDGYNLDNIFEWGFIKLIDVIIFFTTNSQWLFIVCAFLFVFFTYKAISQQSNNIPYSILIIIIGGHYFAGLNLMRNFVALAIVLYAFKYVKEQKIVPYTIWVLIASTLHTSVLLLYPLYFIYNIKLSRKLTIGLTLATCVGLPVLDIVFEYIISFTDYYWYYNDNNSNITMQTSLLIINLIIMIVQMYYYYRNKDDKLYNMYIKIQLITTLIAICSAIVPMTRRIILVPQFLQIIYIPYITKYEKNKVLKFIINCAICLIYAYVTYRQIAILGMHEVLPYQSIFDI